MTANVVGYVRLGGGGIGHYVAYKIEVNYDRQTWIVYRRYSQFYSLHSYLILCQFFDNKILNDFNINLPDKETIGTYAGSIKSIVLKRQTYLQAYIASLCAYLTASGGGLAANSYLGNFFDLSKRGVSGVAQQLGQQKIRLESFAKLKFPADAPVEFLRPYYVVLTKDGMLYGLREYDDDTTAAAVTMKIASGQVTVKAVGAPSTGQLMVADETAQTKLLIKLPTTGEYVEWMRTIGDISLVGNYQSDRSNNKGIALPVGSNTVATPAKTNSPSPVENIHHAGTGATTDELSAMYGV